MPKSKIIIDIVEDNVTLEKSLTRLLVLAKDVKNGKLEQWAELELNGYKTVADAPEYRKFTCSNLLYSGINGGFQVTNIPLPRNMVDNQIYDIISKVTICDGIRYVCEMADSDSMPRRDLTDLAPQIYSATDGMVSCTSIQQAIPQSQYQKVCASVKNKMITALCELEKKYGSLDGLGIDISGQQAVQIEANNAELNRAVFNISVPVPEVSTKKEPWYSKVAWNIIVPIITAIIGAVAAAVILSGAGI